MIWPWHLVLATLATVIVVPRADACSCAMSGPPCQAAWSTDVVFAGVVRSIESVDHPDLGGPYQARRVRFDVDRGFRGIASAVADVGTGTGGGDCGYRFEVGKRYLVYAWRSPDGRLTTGICSRTRPIEAAQDDLKYLASIPPASPGARVYGRVTEIERDPGDDVTVDYGPVEGLLVSVQGTTFTLDATTNGDGRYEITGVPPGKATVSVLPPPRFSSRHLEQPIEIRDPRACVEVRFNVRSEGRISGVVLDAAGRSASNLPVEAIAAEDAAAPRTTSHPKVRTDESGKFELFDLSPGSYVVGVNLAEPARSDTPFPPTFFPGTTDAARAEAIEMAAGDRKELPAFRLGAPLPAVTLAGCVVWPDGRPTPGTLVIIQAAHPRPGYIGPSIHTGSDGCFTASALHGMKYLVTTFAETADPRQRFKAESTITASGQTPTLRLVLAPTR
jgi:hypothetical protein